jgi:leucine-zipper of insertion element IS481
MHRRSKLTLLGRWLLVERVVDQGWPVALPAQAQGVSAATAYKWLRRWRAEGEHGLADRSSRPHRSPRRRSAEREHAIVACRQACRVGPHRIGWALGAAPSRCMRCCAATSCHGGGSWTGRPGRWSATSASGPASCCTSTSNPKAGSRWEVAIGRWGQAGRRHRSGVGYDYLHVAVDDHTRLAYVAAHPRQDGQAAAGVHRSSAGLVRRPGVRVEGC